MERISISIGSLHFEADVYDTDTGRKVIKNLPFKGTINLWGGEVYFSIPINTELEKDARDILEEGELGFWPTGNAFCIFFGPTPVSEGQKPQSYSPVNVFGKIIGKTDDLFKTNPDDTIKVKRKV